jgi:hypothetical protein
MAMYVRGGFETRPYGGVESLGVSNLANQTTTNPTTKFVPHGSAHAAVGAGFKPALGRATTRRLLQAHNKKPAMLCSMRVSERFDAR